MLVSRPQTDTCADMSSSCVSDWFEPELQIPTWPAYFFNSHIFTIPGRRSEPQCFSFLPLVHGSFMALGAGPSRWKSCTPRPVHGDFFSSDQTFSPFLFRTRSRTTWKLRWWRCCRSISPSPRVTFWSSSPVRKRLTPHVDTSRAANPKMLEVWMIKPILLVELPDG